MANDKVSIWGGEARFGRSPNAGETLVGDGSGGFNISTGASIQTVQSTTNTYVFNNTTTYVDTTLSASITPKSASSKILVTVNHAFWLATKKVAPATSGATIGVYGGIKLVRGGTDILMPLSDSFGNPYEIGISGWVDLNVFLESYNRFSIVYLDSPSTSSSLTYKTMYRPYSATSSGTYVGFAVQPFGGTTSDVSTSTMTLTEIAG